MKQGTTLATINKDTEVKETIRIEVNLVPFKTNSITIKTSKTTSRRKCYIRNNKKL